MFLNPHSFRIKILDEPLLVIMVNDNGECSCSKAKNADVFGMRGIYMLGFMLWNNEDEYS